MFCSPSTFFFSISVMEINVKSFAWNKVFFFTDFHQNDIFPYFLMQEMESHTHCPILENHRFFRPRNDDCLDTATARIKYKIHRVSQPFTVTDIDHFLFPQLTYPHFLPLYFFYFVFYVLMDISVTQLLKYFYMTLFI